MLSPWEKGEALLRQKILAYQSNSIDAYKSIGLLQSLKINSEYKISAQNSRNQDMLLRILIALRYAVALILIILILSKKKKKERRNYRKNSVKILKSPRPITELMIVVTHAC